MIIFEGASNRRSLGLRNVDLFIVCIWWATLSEPSSEAQFGLALRLDFKIAQFKVVVFVVGQINRFKVLVWNVSIPKISSDYSQIIIEWSVRFQMIGTLT